MNMDKPSTYGPPIGPQQSGRTLGDPEPFPELPLLAGLPRRMHANLLRMTGLDGTDFQTVLGDLRAELDALDDRLVILLKERSDVIRQVIQRKAASRLGPVDVKREEEMLTRIAGQAQSIGLDPQIATRILRAVIEAFTELESSALGAAAKS
jgi:isochorismate pyruvate lyase